MKKQLLIFALVFSAGALVPPIKAHAAPTMTSFNFTPTSVDTTQNAATVTVTATIEDGTGTGEGFFRINFRSPNIDQDPNRTLGPYQNPPDTDETTSCEHLQYTNGVANCTAIIPVPKNIDSGIWHPEIRMRGPFGDNGDLDWGSSELAAAGYPSVLTITSGPADYTRPTLGSLQLTPSSVDVTNGSQTVHIHATINDVGTTDKGGEFIIFFNKPGEQGGFFAPVCYPLVYSNGTATCDTNFTFDHGKEAGAWTLAVNYSDPVGNGGGMNSSELAAAGFPSTLTVINPTISALPVVSQIDVSPQLTAINTAITTSATFTDADTTDTHTATWNWGDGTTNTGTVNEADGSGTVDGSHTYTAAGIYNITLKVIDNHQDYGASTYENLVVYDPSPSGGTLTESGTYTSQTGWDRRNPSAAGPVNFSIQAQYANGNQIPTGQTTWNFANGNLNFVSTAYSFFVVSGTKSVLFGNGTLNGSGNYIFLASIIHDTGSDKIRFLIFNPTTSGYVYDTQRGDSLLADPTTPIASTATNTAPVLGAITTTPSPIQINSSASVSESFTDADTTDTHTATIDWGDGTATQSGTVTESNGSGTVTKTHTYTALGSHTITVHVTDSANNSSPKQLVISVAPTGGFQGTSIKGANYSGADLSGQNISGGNGKGTNFTGSNLSNTNLSNANLKGANFTNANLTGANLTGANVKDVVWSNTICPNGTNSNSHNNTCVGQGGGL